MKACNCLKLRCWKYPRSVEEFKISLIIHIYRWPHKKVRISIEIDLQDSFPPFAILFGRKNACLFTLQGRRNWGAQCYVLELRWRLWDIWIFLKIAKNGFNMQFNFILNVFCQKIDKLLHISVQFYTNPMTTALSNCLNW